MTKMKNWAGSNVIARLSYFHCEASFYCHCERSVAISEGGRGNQIQFRRGCWAGSKRHYRQEGMKLPKISIITTSYTMDRFKDIIELLDSLQAQSYKTIETIIVAERSPELAENIRSYAQKKDYPNVVALYNQGEWGLSSVRNLGIEKSGSAKTISSCDIL